jgi:formate dehydrogenase iron-sulfur subunit
MGPSAADLGYDAEAKERVGFFTDTSVCIGCKACEVACKEWNLVPEDGLVWTGESYDNTSELGANAWRHVAFIEQRKPLRVSIGPVQGSDPGTGPQRPSVPDSAGIAPDPEEPATAYPQIEGSDPWTGPEEAGFRWLMSSDVCKHCTEAACLDVCPTGALFRTEFDTVVVQEDVCNGCGYCVPACPFGVLDRREIPDERGKPDGRVWKCTLCYDRLKGGLEPACAKACPTDSIQFGPLDELRERAENRLAKLESEGWNGARLYGERPNDGVGGFGAFFLLLDEPEVYGLPPDPVASTRDLASLWKSAAAAMGVLAVGVLGAFLGGAR